MTLHILQFWPHTDSNTGMKCTNNVVNKILFDTSAITKQMYNRVLMQF